MLFGVFIGPLAAVLLRLAPLGRCPTCEADVRGWEKLCGWCGNDVTGAGLRGQPAAAPASTVAVEPLVAAAPAVADGSATATSTSTTRRRRATSATAAAASRKNGSATTNGTRRRKAAATATSTATATVPPAVPPAEPPTATPSPAAPTTMHWVASGVYLTGTGGLEPGARYSLELDGLKFIVRGPVDTDPNRISVACDVADLDASAAGDRLVIDRPVVGRPSSFVLGFVGIAGGTPKAIAARIMESADQARRANP
jgi:hypothetical protein